MDSINVNRSYIHFKILYKHCKNVYSIIIAFTKILMHVYNENRGFNFHTCSSASRATINDRVVIAYFRLLVYNSLIILSNYLLETFVFSFQTFTEQIMD